MIRRFVAPAALVVLLAGCGAGSVPSPRAPFAGPYATAVAESLPTVLAELPVGAISNVSTPAMVASKPVGLVVPSIGVRAEGLLPLNIDKMGGLEVPPDAGTAGWYVLAPTPGAVGPAVIAAHVDYKGVSGLFAKIKDLAAGAEIRVPREDGSVAVFTTYRVDKYPKSGFPSDKVYGNTTGPELRLITCGGSFDTYTGHYRDNVVAYARLTGIG